MLATRSHRALAVAAVATGVLVAVTACGSAENAADDTSGSSPTHAAAAGFAALLDSSALTATLRLDTDRATLVALSGAEAGSTPLSTERAGAIVGGSLVLAARTGGGSFREPTGAGAFALTLNAGGAPRLVQVVVDGTTLYARAAVAPLLALLGTDSAQITSLLNSPVVPPQLSFLTSAIAGDWLKLNLSAVAGQLPSLPATGASPSVDPSRIPGFVTSVQKIFRDDVTVTRAGAGPDLGDHLILSGNLRTVGTDLLHAVAGLVPGTSQLLGDAKPSALPDKQIRIDEYVKDGAVSALRIDLTQLLDTQQTTAAAGRPVVLDIDLARSATIAAPTDAVAVDPSALSAVSGLLGSTGLGSPLGSSSSAP